MKKRTLLMVVLGLVLVAACGDAPLGTLGNRSAEWINEPTVPSTVPRVVEAPKPVDTKDLGWANDEILNTQFDNTDEFLAEVFGRREGDRFIQASRTEIAFALPGVMFPAQAPPAAEWVSSQLVFDNNGSLSVDPSAAFGIWSAEPYTRSRSVAQMAVLRVAMDDESGNEVFDDNSAGCALFADETTQKCEHSESDGLHTWELTAPGGLTLVWIDRGYRYELFGRSFVPKSDLMVMRSNTIALSSLDVDG